MAHTITPLTPHTGAEIRDLDLTKPVDAETRAVLNAAFGLSPGDSRTLWWLLASVALGFAFWLLYALYQASGEQPIP